MTDVDTVLPLPAGDPPLLANLGKNLAYVATHGVDTALARSGSSGLDLGGSWSGAAFQAASIEAQAGARLSHEVCDRFGPVVCALNEYAGALANARRSVEALREQWVAADRLLAETIAPPLAACADPAAAAQLTRAADAHRELTRAELLTRHTACLRALQTAENLAAATVSSVLGTAVSAAAQRQALLAQLPLTDGAQGRATAVDLVDRAVAGLSPDPTTWSVTELQRVLDSVASSADDPVVAQVLMTRMGAAGLEHAAKALGVGPGEFPFPDAAARHDALALLGVVFAVSVSDRPASDPVSAAALGQSRPGWIKALLEQPLSSVTDQLALLAAAATGPSRIVPGLTYAVGAAQALMSRSGPLTDRVAWQAATRAGRPTLTMGPAPDPYRLLFSALATDPALARGVLLATGRHGETVVHDLVVDLPLGATRTVLPLTSSLALGQLMSSLELAPNDPLANEFLTSVGDAGRGWWALQGQDSINADAHLNPLRWPAAVLLSENPSRVGDAVEPVLLGTAVDATAQASAARMQALLGEIAKDVTTSPDAHATPRGLSVVLASVAAFEARQLGEQVDRTAPGTRPAELDNAAMRLGQVVGFTAESATVTLRHAGEQLDGVNTSERAAFHGLVGAADLVPLPKGHPALAVLAIIKDPLMQLVTTAFDNAHPVDNAAQSAANEKLLMGRAQALVTRSAGEQVLHKLGHQAASQVLVRMAATTVDTGARVVNETGPEPTTAP